MLDVSVSKCYKMLQAIFKIYIYIYWPVAITQCNGSVPQAVLPTPQ